MLYLSEQTITENVGAMPRTIRDHNRKLVLKAVAERDTFSVTDIAADVMLSRQSVMKALTHFLDRGLIVSLGKGSSTEIGGKKPEMYVFRPPQRILAILHRTNAMVFQLMDMACNCLDTLSIPISKAMTDDEFVEALRAGAQKMMMRNPDLKTTLYGVAMAVGGQVELEHHTMHRSMYFSNLSVDLPVYDILQTIFPEVPCIQVDCIGRMAGQSVLFNTELIRKNKRVFTLYIDRGITGCFFMDGKLQTESTLMLLEAGHMVLDAHDDERCTCGKYGCAESLISLQRMRSSIEEQLPQYPDSCLAHIAPRLVGFDDVFSGSRSGDALCRCESQRLANAIGHLLRNIFLVCEPGLVVFMGNFSNADAVFDKTLREAVQSDYVYTLREGTFDVFYDHRELPAIEAQGCAQSVIKFFYDDERLYT